jgi:hypothetical protein
MIAGRSEADNGGEEDGGFAKFGERVSILENRCTILDSLGSND